MEADLLPFRAFPAIEILSAKAHDKLKAPESIVPDMAEPVRNVVGKMLEKDRDKRYADCDTLIRDLDRTGWQLRVTRELLSDRRKLHRDDERRRHVDRAQRRRDRRPSAASRDDF